MRQIPETGSGIQLHETLPGISNPGEGEGRALGNG